MGDDPTDGLKPLCEAVAKKDSGAASQVMQAPAWMNLVAIAGASSDSGRPGTSGGAAGASAGDGFGEFGTGGIDDVTNEYNNIENIYHGIVIGVHELVLAVSIIQTRWFDDPHVLCVDT